MAFASPRFTSTGDIVEMSGPPSISSAGAPVASFSDLCKSPYQERAETFQQLELTQKRKSQSETELQSLVRMRSSTPSMSPVEMNETNHTIWGLQRQIESMNYQIHEMLAKLDRQETVIAQQQTTIRNQSKAIENPRNAAQYIVTTTHQRGQHERQPCYPEVVSHGPPPPPYGSPHGANPRGGPAQTWAQQYSRISMSGLPEALPVPTIFNQARSANSSVEMATAASNRQQSFHEVDDYGSPHRARNRTVFDNRPMPSETGRGSARTYSVFNGESRTNIPVTRPAVHVVAPPAPVAPPFPRPLTAAYSPQSSFSNPYAEPKQDDQRLTSTDTFGSHDAAISDQFFKVFACCKNWALNHCNFPNTSGDNALPQELKSRIIRAASMQTAFPLMKHPETRYWLIAKLLIQYLLKHILRHNTFAGLDREADQCIDGLRQTIYQSTPSPLRFVILKNIAEKTHQIIRNPKFPGYLNYLTRTRAERLFWDVRSLKHKVTLHDQEDILILVGETHRLAQMINTSTDEYAFNWAEIGDRFDRFSMHNDCPRYGACSDDEMRNRWATVRLCAIPEVVVRKNSQDSSMVEEVKLQKMRVLLKVRNED